MEQTIHNQFNFLKKRTGWLTTIAIVLVLLVIGLIVYLCNNFDTIKANEIKLVDNDGNVLLRVAAPLPNPKVQGTEYERSHAADGAQFLDKSGNEVGRLALNSNEGVGGLCFNYESGEAACFYKDKEDVALDFYSKKQGTEAGTGTKRFALGFSGKDGASYLALIDNSGKERIKMSVDDVAARIQMFDANGHETYSISN